MNSWKKRKLGGGEGNCSDRESSVGPRVPARAQTDPRSGCGDGEESPQIPQKPCRGLVWKMGFWRGWARGRFQNGCEGSGAVGSKIWDLVVCFTLCFHGDSQIQGPSEGQLLKLERRDPDPRCPRGEEAGIGMWEFLERTLSHSDPSSDPSSRKVPPGKPGGGSCTPELGGSQGKHGSGSCLPRVEVPHPWARTRSQSLPGTGMSPQAPLHPREFYPAVSQGSRPMGWGVLAQQRHRELGSHGIPWEESRKKAGLV